MRMILEMSRLICGTELKVEHVKNNLENETKLKVKYFIEFLKTQMELLENET